MANSKVVIEVTSTAKGLKMTTKQVDDQAKSVDKLSDSQEKLGKRTDNTNKKEKALYQTNLSSAKGFSKMNQTIGGSSGSGALVGSYAILAANVFAVTAAFNTLRRAAAVEKLAEGLQQFSATTGQSLDLVSKRLQEATGYAVSFEESMKTAALLTSAGFGTTEMEGLTKVAKGASLALGRDMGDALDRLTRGAVKLEPEILDELGIMVRLDEATENYAAQLGKSAGALTRFERQQAFMNAIIAEGTDKFAQIGDNIDPNAYDTLAAAFADLSKNFLNLLNNALVPTINFFLKFKGLFIGIVTIFAGSIINRMIPAFGDLANSSKQAAAAALEGIEAAVVAGGRAADANLKNLRDLKGFPASYRNIVGAIRQGTATTKEMTIAQGQLTRQINKLEKEGGPGLKNLTKAQRAYLEALKQTRQAIINIKKNQEGTAAKKQLDIANANLRMAEREADLMDEANRRTFTFKGTLLKYRGVLKGIGTATKQYYTELMVANGITAKSSLLTRIYTTALVGLKSGFRAAAISAKIFGRALLNAIPIIGQVIVVVMLLVDALKWVAKKLGFGETEEQKKAKEAWKDFEMVLDGIPDKMKAIEQTFENASHSSTPLIQNLQILGGLYKTIAEEAFKAEMAQVKAGDLDDDRNYRRTHRVFKDSPIAQGMRDLEEQDRQFRQFSSQAISARTDGAARNVTQWVDQMRKSGMTIKQIRANLLDLMRSAEVTFNGISAAAKDAGMAFTELDKVSGAFFRKFGKKTEYDELNVAMSSLQKSISKTVVELSQAGTSVDFFAVMGELSQSMTKGTAILFGEEVNELYNRRRKIGADIIADKQKLMFLEGRERDLVEERIERREDEYKIVQNKLGKALYENFDAGQQRLFQLKEQNLQLKVTVDFYKELTTRVKAIGKDEFIMSATLKLQNSLLKKQREELQSRLDEFKVAFDEARKDPSIPDNFSMLQEEAAIIREIQKINVEITESEEIVARVRLARVETLQEEIKLQKSILDMTQKNTGIAAGLGARRKGTTMSEADLGKQALEFAKQRFNLTLKETALKMSVLSLEFELIQVKALQTKADNQAEIKLLKEKNAFTKEEQEVIKQLEAHQQRELEWLMQNHKKMTEDELSQFGIRYAQTADSIQQIRLLYGEVNEEDMKRVTQLEEINGLIDKSLISSKNILSTQGDLIRTELINSALTLENTTFSFLDKLDGVFTAQGGGDILAQMADSMTQSSEEKLKRKMRDSMKSLLKELEIEGADVLGGPGDAVSEEGASFLQNFKIPDGWTEEQKQKFELWKSTYDEMVEHTKGKNFELANSFAMLAASITSIFGEEGAVVAGMANFMSFTLTTFDEFENKSMTTAEKWQVAADTIGQIGSIMAASSAGQIREIDKQIEAEKKRDGKSKESLAKIKEMEKKKEAMARKAFEMNKKMLMAQTIANTAAGIMSTMKEAGFWASPFAMIVAAMGAAQLAIISKQKFEGSSGSVSEPRQQALNIGKAANRIDVSRGAQAGEVGYLRGQRGMPGGAAGMKRYADGYNGPIVVGERGPEVVQPTTAGYNVIPNDQLGGLGGTNVNFTINAIDSTGMEQVLVEQRGNIIEMIKQAANETGERILEEVDTQAMGATGGGYGG